MTRFGTEFAVCLLIAGSIPSAAQSTAGKDPMQEHYEAANHFLNTGDQENAAVEYKAFLTDALHRLANGEAQAGSFDDAFGLFKEALTFQPTNSEIQTDFAAASLDAERLTQAKDLAEQVVEANPRNPRARVLLGRILYDSENYPQAKTQLETAVSLNSDFETGYLLGKTYLILHEDKKARALFDEMIAGLGDTALLHTYFARAYSLMDYPDLAMREFQRAISLDSHARDVHYYLALAYLRHDESTGYAKAVPEFQAELKNNPQDPRSHYMLGYIALKQRRFADAEKELTQVLALQPDDLNAEICLAEAYLSENRAEDAKAMLRKALAKNGAEQQSQLTRAHYLLGRLLMKQGKVEEGRRELQMSSSADSFSGTMGTAAEPRLISSASLVQQESRERSGQKFETKSSREKQQVEQLRAEMARAIADAYNNLGAIAATHHEYREAVHFFETSRVWDPAIAGIDRNVGMAAFYEGDYDKAVPSLQQYLLSHPEDATIRSMVDQALGKRNGNDHAPK